jgi:hypothetical protein
LRVLAEPTPELSNLFLVQCQTAFKEMLEALQSMQEETPTEAKDHILVQPDDLISFRSLK